MKSNIVFSKESDHWETPKDIYNYFIKKKYIDPCPFHSEVDNLKNDLGGVNLFINPPYSNISEWVDYSINHINKHEKNEIVFLIPARTDTKYFHKLMNQDFMIYLYFIKGRLKFSKKGAAPFPSVLISLRKYKCNCIHAKFIEKEEILKIEGE